MNPIDSLFQTLRSEGRKAFIPFVSAGDPDLATTAAVVRRLADAGANLVEIGFPYSDPIADGPVIQASFTRALETHIQVDDIFGCIRRLCDDPAFQARRVPLVGMLSYSLVYRRGPEKFLDQSRAAGLSGLIVPDLPADEAEPLVQLAAARDFKLIHLVTPTTPPGRAARIARLSTGFLYVVSITGITGERDRLPDDVHAQLKRLRGLTDLPLCIGFGISTPEHVRLLRDEVDGLIVGSALVRRLAEARRRQPDEVVEEIGSLAKSLVAALNP
jgi:tryptophan synthase alpha chain